MFGIRKRRERIRAERMKKVRQYEYVKKSLIECIGKLEGLEDCVIRNRNLMYSVAYFEDDLSLNRIRRTPNRKSFEDIKFIPRALEIEDPVPVRRPMSPLEFYMMLEEERERKERDREFDKMMKKRNRYHH